MAYTYQIMHLDKTPHNLKYKYGQILPQQKLLIIKLLIMLQRLMNVII